MMLFLRLHKVRETSPRPAIPEESRPDPFESLTGSDDLNPLDSEDRGSVPVDDPESVSTDQEIPE